ncbi:MAG TPA: TIR domain-containing protein [Streptosporangiaceae bacterium]|nr:TIR domain-containing protein [Streptosporangiaceae bacterium]
MAEIFVSHASADNVLAGHVADGLRRAGHGIFLDSDHAEGIAPGAVWQRTLLHELRICDAVVFLNSKAAQVSMWCHSELVVAIDLGKHLYSLDLDRDILPHPLLKSVQGIVLDSGIDGSIARLVACLDPGGLASSARLRWERDRPPYPGLVAMDVADAGVFFGREEEIRELVARVDRPLGSRDSDLVVVMGPSGAGKSSLVRAGLAASLGVPRSGWAVVSPFEPGIAPLDRLVIRLAAVAPDRLDETECRDRLLREGLAAFGEWLAEHAPVPARRPLIIVDQAEQLATVTPAAEREEFLAVLAGGLRPGSPVTVVLTVRSNRFDEIQQLGQIGPAIQAPFVIAPMDRSRLPMVIEGPAHRADLTLEPGLAGRLADDAARGSGEACDALPFLAFVLREMYDLVVREGRTTLTHADYERTGRIEGAISRRTEAAEAALPPDSGPVLDRMLTRFVAVDDERQPFARLVQRASLSAPELAVAEILANQRLVVGTAYSMRLAHERLITAWPRLAAAVAERRDDLVLQARLERQATDWEDGHGELLGRDATAYARSWLGGEAEASGTLQKYVQVSERALRRRRTSIIGTLAVVAVLALAASLTAVVAVMQRSDAVRQSQLAQSDEMAAQAVHLLPADTPLAMLLSLQAYERAPTVQAGSAVIEAAQQPLDEVLSAGSQVNGVAFSPNGRILAVGSLSGFVGLWDVATGRRVGTLNEGSPVYSLAFSPDGRTVAVGDDAGDVGLWDVAARRRLASLVEGSGVYGLAFSPDGCVLAAGDLSGFVGLWNLATERRTGQLTEGIPVKSVAFSPDGRTLAAADDVGFVYLWDVATGRRTGELAENSPPNSVAFDPSDQNVGQKTPKGGTLAVGDDSGAVMIWSVGSKNSLGSLNDGDPAISVSFSPDGRILAVGHDNGDINLWNAVSGLRMVTLHEGSPADSVAFSPDGRTLAVGDVSGFVGLWNVAGARRAHVTADGSISNLAFSPDGRRLAVGGERGEITLWNAATEHRTGTLPQGSPIHGLAFSPNGRTLAAGDDNGNIKLWDVMTGKWTSTLNSGDPVGTVAFSPDGAAIATSGADGDVSLWNVATGQRTAAWPTASPVSSLAFSPGGGIIAAGGGGDVSLFSVAAKHQVATLHESGPVTSVAFSQHDRILAIGDANGQIELRQVNGWHRFARLSDSSPVSSVAFSPNGQVVVAGDKGGFVGLWDVASGRQIASIATGVGGAILAISPDGRVLAIGGSNGSLVFLRQNLSTVTRSYFIRVICGKVRHNMTRSQWAEFVPGLPYQRTCP